MTQGKILVVRGGAIGDFILTLPVLAALRRQFPAARLEVLGYGHIASLALAGGLADGLRAIEARPVAGFFARAGDLDFELSSYFAGFQVIFSYLYDPDEIFRTNLARITKAQVIQGPHRPLDSRAEHAADQLLEPLQRLAIFDADPQPRLQLGATADRRGVPTVALHPGAGGERKTWPETHWRELIRRLLAESEVNLFVLGGEAEGDRLEQLTADLPPARVSLLRNAPLTAVAAALTGCIGFVGHDSGPTHLAAALGLPGLALWGPTNATVWRPHSERFGLLTAGPDLADLPVATVLAELRSRLPGWME